MKKKTYCAQRHLNSRQVIIQLENDIRDFQNKAFNSITQISSLSFTPYLCRISISPNFMGYIPHKGWPDIIDSCFNGTFIAWITDFSFRVAADKDDMLAIYKIKNGQRLLISKDAVKIEHLFGAFWIGKHRFSYKRHKHGNIDLTQYTVKTVH